MKVIRRGSKDIGLAWQNYFWSQQLFMRTRKFFVPITIALLSGVICLKATSKSVATTPTTASTIAQAIGNNNAALWMLLTNRDIYIEETSINFRVIL